MSLRTQQDYRLGYRAGIEGLRAVAILLVVAAHAGLPGLAGGFIGVDVFFVLSGYLITGLLVKEMQTTQDLRFANFYARRLRRLLPALLLMLGITSALGWLLLAPSEQLDQATAAASAALWISNFRFAFGNTDYFAPESNTNLFLHTWSLGVEEQFYLLWPLLLAFIAGMRRSTSASISERLPRVLLAVFAFSLTLCLYWTWKTPLTAFYMMPSRAWQFSLGALVYLKFGTQIPAGARRHMAVIGWLGLAMIVSAAALLNQHMSYPGAWALLPSLGTICVLAAGDVSRGPQLLLSLRPMQALGRLSYAWYLWHWPVLLLAVTVVNTNSIWQRITVVLLSLLIAAASYRLVEAPLRRSEKLLTRPRMAVLAAIALMLVASSFALRWYNAASAHLGNADQQRYQQVRYDVPLIYAMGCDEWYRTARVHICSFGKETASHTAVAIGDSVAAQWFPAYAHAFDKPDWRLLVITKSACPMVDEPIFYERIGREYIECAQWRRDALKTIANTKPEIVILGSADTYNYTEMQWTEGTRRILQTLSGSVEQIYLMRSTPLLPFDGPSCLARRSPLRAMLRRSADCSAPAADIHSDRVFGWLNAAASITPNVSTIDMTEDVCPDGLCRAEHNGLIVFRDNRHLSTAFVESLAPIVMTKLHMNPALDNQPPNKTGPSRPLEKRSATMRPPPAKKSQ